MTQDFSDFLVLLEYYHQPWLAFKRPNVRDLAYAISCPPVLSKLPPECDHDLSNHLSLPDTQFWQQHFLNYLPRLYELERNPKPLNQFLGTNLLSFRLGFRFEALLLFWLLDTDYHDYELIAHNVQIFEGVTTLSELDFIVKNTVTHEVEHWEVAVKFFLGAAPFTAECWQGLKGTDNLYKKVTNMLNKPFSHRQVNIDGRLIEIDKRILIIKGRFYEPEHQIYELNSTELPWLNPKLPRGTWFNHFPEVESGQEWRLGRRVEWFTKRDCYDAYDLNQHEKQLNNPINSYLNPCGRRTPLHWRTGLYFNHLNDDKCEHSVMLRLD